MTDIEELRRLVAGARERAEAREMFVVDGDPYEHLAKAMETHAANCDDILTSLGQVSLLRGCLGTPDEGVDAVNLLRENTLDGPSSFKAAVRAQRDLAKQYAAALRKDRENFEGVESATAASIDSASGH